MLIAVIFLGTEAKGSRSWFEFGQVRFQPAEISKISTSLMLATIMGQFGFKMSKTRNFLTVAGIILLPMLIIIAQNETGSALVYVGFAFVLYREGLSGWLLFIIGMAIVLFIMTLMVSPYAAIMFLAVVTSFCNAVCTGQEADLPGSARSTRRSIVFFVHLLPRMRKQMPVSGSVQMSVLRVFSVGISTVLPLAEDVTTVPVSFGSPNHSRACIPRTVTVSGVFAGEYKGCFA